jgi:Tripartite tricarboxylate transporter family receptor
MNAQKEALKTGRLDQALAALTGHIEAPEVDDDQAPVRRFHRYLSGRRNHPAVSGSSPHIVPSLARYATRMVCFDLRSCRSNLSARAAQKTATYQGRRRRIGSLMPSAGSLNPAFAASVLGEHVMKLSRLQFLKLAAGAAALPVLSRIARGQAYPSRLLRCIVGYAPGGGTDIFVRLVGQPLSERLGQPFVIENRAGAASNIATEAVVHAPADGYTLLGTDGAAAINATLYENLSAQNFSRRTMSIIGSPEVFVGHQPTLSFDHLVGKDLVKSLDDLGAEDRR